MVPENLHIKQKRAAGAVDLQDPPDEPGAETAKGARVWRNYVRETDRWDREMVDGCNNSLDVLMIFATLFSAISTAFVVLSLSDLKPDYAKESAQTLLIVSQTLTATANNYSVPLPAQLVSSTTTFSPTRSAVVVNVLLLLSLSLSVVVSLVTMLGKEWCYKFMSGRSGQIYEQARRRQKRWNGIELWKMREVLTYLPGVMHLALLLFATGLSVYLWNININVAVPVILMTTLATLLYIIVTLLPVVDRFCPYSTPSTAMLEQSARVLFKLAETGTFRIASYLFRKVNHPQRLKTILRTTYNSLRPRGCSSILDDSSASDTGVPMDIVTSQMLAWLLANCEDSQSISTVLQAIAGARPDLQHAPLAQCGVYELVVSRLNSYTRMDHGLEQYCVKDISTLPVALGYCRSYSALISGDAYECPWDNWKVGAGKPKIVKGELEDFQMIKVHLDLLHQAKVTGCDFNTLATGTAAAMRYCHWAETHTSNPAPRHIAPELAASILSEHLQDAGRTLSIPALHTLVESTSHYLTALWMGEKRHNPRSLLVLRLAQVYLASHATMPDTAAAAAVALAAAAFLADSYPGGEHLLPKDREKRAVQVLQFYQANKPTNHTMSLLFTFGFTGLLSSLDFKSLATEVTFMPSLLAAAAGYIAPYVRSSGEVDIHTLPQSVPLADYLMISACRSLLLVAHYSFDHVNEPAIGVIYSNFMLQNLDIACADSRLYTAALKSLCYAQSNDLHDLCFKILDAQPVPVHLSQLPEAFKDHHFLERLCDTSLSSTAMPTVTSATTLHFKLLVATIILSTDCPLEDRQSLLRPILNCRHEFAGLEPSVPDHSLPGTESFLLHIQQGRSGESSIQQTMLHTMQYVVDFCHADPKLNPPANINPSKEPPTPDWRVTLQEIKNTHRLSSQIIRPSNVEPPSYTPTNVVSQGAQMPNDGRPNVTYPRVPNQTGWGSLNDSRPMPQLVSNVNALRTGPLNANPPYTNHEGPSSWGPPTQAPNRPSTPYGQMPEPNHYRPDPRLVVPSFGGPQVPAPQNPNYQNPAGPSPRVPGQPVRQWHSDMYPEPYQPTQNSAPNVPVPWQYSNRPEDNYLPGQMTMPRPEGYLHDLNNHSSNADCSGCQKSWGFEPPVETPRQRPVQNFELHGADLQEGTGLSSEHGDPGSYKRRNLPPLPHSPNDNTGLLYPLLGSDPEA